MIVEMLDRLGDQHTGLLASSILSEQRNEGCLSSTGVLADTLAGDILVPRSVDQIIGNLKCQSDIARIAAIGCPRFLRQPSQDR